MRPWSYSALTLYETCPQAYKLRYIDRIKDQGNEAMDRGNRIHTHLEGFLEGSAPLPVEAKELVEYYRKIQQSSPRIEENWGFTQDWQPVSWSHPDIWCRMKLDAYIPAETSRIIDHKTGKYRALKAMDQGQLYAVGASIMDPREAYSAEFAYVDQAMVKTKTYKHKMVERFQEKFTARATKLGMDSTFQPKPHKITCKYCPMRESCIYSAAEEV